GAVITNKSGATVEAIGVSVELTINGATSFANDGLLLSTGGATLDLESLTVTNTGTVQVAASSFMDLEIAVVNGGIVINSGTLIASTSTTNAINGAAITNNAGATLGASGSGVELVINGAVSF